MRVIHVLRWMCFEITHSNNFLRSSWTVVEKTEVILVILGPGCLGTGQLMLSIPPDKISIKGLLLTFEWGVVHRSGSDRNVVFLLTKVNHVESFFVAHFCFIRLFSNLFTGETFNVWNCLCYFVELISCFRRVSWLSLAYKPRVETIFLLFLLFLLFDLH